MATGAVVNLPPGFELEQEPQLPEGFVLEGAEKPSSSFSLKNAAVTGLTSLAKGTDTALSAGASGLARLFGASPEEQDKIYRGLEERRTAIDQFQQDHAPNTNMAERIVGNVVAVPGMIPGMLGQTQMDAAEQVFKEGGTLGQARTAGGIQAVTGMAGGLVPGGRAVQAVANTASGAAGDYFTQKYLESVGLKEAAKNYDPTNVEARILDAAVGAAFTPRTKADPDKSNKVAVLEKLDQIDNATKPLEMPEGFRLMTDEEVAASIQRPAEEASVARQDGIDFPMEQREGVGLPTYEYGEPAKLTVEKTVDGRDLTTYEAPGLRADPLPELEINQKTTDTPQFKKWFEGSKIVDDNGEPLVVYHGTTKDITSFDPTAKRNLLAQDAQGLYFTAYAEDASNYAGHPRNGDSSGANVVPVYLQIKNPKIVDNGNFEISFISKKAREQLEAQGYDGLISKDKSEIVAFYPEQIKSAVGNRGTFDPTNPRIDASLGNITEAKLPIERFGKITPDGRFDIATPLRYIAENSENPSFRPLAEELLKLDDKVPLIASLAKDEAGEYSTYVTLGKDASGQALKSVAEHRIRNDGGAELKFGTAGLTERAVLHELVHAATVKRLLVEPDHPTSREINSIFQTLRDTAAKAGDAEGLKQYGLRANAFEFITEALTNPKFQEWLAKHDLSGKPTSFVQSAFQKITQAISKLFGRDVNLNNALDRVVAVSESIIKDYTARAAEIDSRYAANPAEFTSNRAIYKAQESLVENMLDEASGGNFKASENVGQKLKPEILPQEAMKGPWGVLKDNYIPDDPDVNQALAKSRGEKDSNLRFNSLQSGGSLTAEKTGSTLIGTITRLYQNANKRAELAIKNIVTPVESLLGKVIKTPDVEILSEVFKREMFKGTRYTAEQLQQSGISSKVIEAYQGMRKMFDAALQAQNEGRVAKGMRPITGIDAYMASRWQGNFRLPVYSTDGKLIWYLAGRSKREVSNALEYLKSKGIEIDESKTSMKSVRYHGIGKGKPDVIEAYQAMLDILDPNDPRVGDIKSVMEEATGREAFGALGQSKHFEEKGNIRGFVGDRPWKKTREDAVDFVKEQLQYAKNAFRWSEVNKISEKSKVLLSDEVLNKEQPRNVSYAREYAKNQLGLNDTAWIRQMEDSFSKALGVDKSYFYNTVGIGKSLFYMQKLGANVGYMMANLIQPVFTTAAHRMLSREGYKHNAAYTMAAGLSDASGALLREINPKAKIPMTKIGEEAYQYAKDNGIIARSQFDDIQQLDRPAPIRMLENTLGRTISAPESIARGTAFMSFVHHLDQSKKFTDRTELFQRAEELTNIWMIDYRTAERPMIFDRMGLVGESLATLQTFKFGYFNQLHLLAQKAVKTKDFTPLAVFLGVQYALAGVNGMPGMDELDDAWELLKSQLPDSAYAKVKDLGVKSFAIQNLDTSLAYGPLSSTTGVAMNSRFDMSNVQDFAFDSLFPFIADMYKQGEAVTKAAFRPNSETAMQAAMAVTPTGLQGALETNTDTFKGPQTQEGRQIYYRANDPDTVSAKRTKEEETLRALGLRSVPEAMSSELRFRENKMEKETTARKKEIAAKVTQALRTNPEKVQEYFDDYIALEGDPAQLVRTVTEKIQNRNLTLEERQILSAASSIASAKKAQRAKARMDRVKKEYN